MKPRTSSGGTATSATLAPPPIAATGTATSPGAAKSERSSSSTMARGETNPSASSCDRMLRSTRGNSGHGKGTAGRQRAAARSSTRGWPKGPENGLLMDPHRGASQRKS